MTVLLKLLTALLEYLDALYGNSSVDPKIVRALLKVQCLIITAWCLNETEMPLGLNTLCF